MVLKNSTKDFDLIPRDGRKKMFLTLDTETAGDINKGVRYVYDLGFAVHDKQGNIYYKRNFLISEVFDNEELMKTAYYSWKIYEYEKMLRDGKIEKVSLSQVVKFLQKIISEYNIDCVCAYNLFFDAGALRFTLKKLMPKTYRRFTCDSAFDFLEIAVFRKIVTFVCIYNFACQVLATQNNYAKVALMQNGRIEENDWITEHNNVRTNAQCMYRYISGNYSFMEAHTALRDVEIEIKILSYCFRQHKKFDKKIVATPWRIPQENFQKIQMQMCA